ncbi:hypothetical protein MKX03_024476, partial [Papaver bracteatum]
MAIITVVQHQLKKKKKKKKKKLKLGLMTMKRLDRVTRGNISEVPGNLKSADLSLIGNGKQIPHVIKNWVEQYEKSPKSAMVELLMMLFEVVSPLEERPSHTCHLERHLVATWDTTEESS